ncbi:unnamed protein product [Closterium sp. NIES-54]
MARRKLPRFARPSARLMTPVSSAPLVAPPASVCLGPDPPALVVVPDPPAPAGALSVPAIPAPPLAAVAPSAPIPVGARAVPNPAVGSSPQVVSATTGSSGPRESRGATLPIVPAPSAVVPQTQRPPSPGGRQHRSHSPAPSDERERSRQRHDSPWRCGFQANWVASFVSAAVREERNGQASQSNSPRGPPTRAPPPPVAAPPPATALPKSDVPPPFAPAASAAAPGNCMRLPWIPLVAGTEFVTAADAAGNHPNYI